MRPAHPADEIVDVSWKLSPCAFDRDLNLETGIGSLMIVLSCYVGGTTTPTTANWNASAIRKVTALWSSEANFQKELQCVL